MCFVVSPRIIESSITIIRLPSTFDLRAVSLVCIRRFFFSMPVPTFLPMNLFFIKPMPNGIPDAFA